VGDAYKMRSRRTMHMDPGIDWLILSARFLQEEQ